MEKLGSVRTVRIRRGQYEDNCKSSSPRRHMSECIMVLGQWT